MIKFDDNNILDWKVRNGDIVKTYYHNIPCFQKAVAPSFKWVTFSNGDTIPSDLDVYGVSGISQDLYSTYGGSGTSIIFQPSRNFIEYYVYEGEYSVCASGSELKTDPIEIIFSNRGCSDFINQGGTVSGTIQLLIYA